MKRLFYLLIMCLFVSNIAFADPHLTGNEADSLVESGEYSGKILLTNHMYENTHDIYFEARWQPNGIESFHATAVPKPENLEELLTFAYMDKTYTYKRGQWYQLLSASLPQDSKPHNLIRTLVGEAFYDEWFNREEANFGCTKIVDYYVHQVYFPRVYPEYTQQKKVNRYSTADIDISSATNQEKPKKKGGFLGKVKSAIKKI